MIVQEICRKSGCSIQVHEEELRWNIRYYKDHNKCHCNFVVFLQNQIREDTNWIKCSHSIEGSQQHMFWTFTLTKFIYTSVTTMFIGYCLCLYTDLFNDLLHTNHIFIDVYWGGFLFFVLREDWASWYHRYGYRGSWLGLVRTHAIKLIPWWWRKSNKLAITESAC